MERNKPMTRNELAGRLSLAKAKFYAKGGQVTRFPDEVVPYRTVSCPLSIYGVMLPRLAHREDHEGIYALEAR